MHRDPDRVVPGRAPGRRPVLIDTGLHPSCAVDPKQNLGRVASLAFRGLKVGEQGAWSVEQLRPRGIEPTDV